MSRDSNPLCLLCIFPCIAALARCTSGHSAINFDPAVHSCRLPSHLSLVPVSPLAPFLSSLTFLLSSLKYLLGLFSSTRNSHALRFPSRYLCNSPQGVGKSTVMQLLHGDATTSFNVQQSAAETQATHTTVGVDVAVTQEHGILLDSQPMQSLAVVDALAKRKSPMVAGCRSYVSPWRV